MLPANNGNKPAAHDNGIPMTGSDRVSERGKTTLLDGILAIKTGPIARQFQCHTSSHSH